jgi:hypothetical protein
MAKVYTGRDGRLLIDGIEQIKVSNWTLTGSLEVLETTTLGESQRSYTPGVQEFNGSATLLYYKDDAGRNDAATALKKVLRVSGCIQQRYGHDAAAPSRWRQQQRCATDCLHHQRHVWRQCW